MTSQERIYLRAAMQFRQTFQRPKESSPEVCLPESKWQAVQRAHFFWREVRRKGWHRAEECCTERLRTEVLMLLDLLQSLRRDLSQPPEKLPLIRVLVEDLRSLADDFDEVSIDLRESTITAVTEPITLSGISFGPFAIVLKWTKRTEAYPYRVRAIEPNPASTDEEVTHPHVNHEALCEGTAADAIRLALDQGRISDFFLLVRQVLRTYNSDSPYVSLDDWKGFPCSDCGDLINEDQYTCSDCSSTVCEHCVSSCQRCSGTSCAACLESCPACENLFCGDCLRPCSCCSQNHCLECLNEEELCAECLEAPDAPQAAVSPLHADGLGETPLPA